jgi:hypothetical protein
MVCKNPWIKHLAKVRKENPKVKDVKKLAQLAKKTYSPKKVKK